MSDFSFGIFTDVHYANKPAEINRYYDQGCLRTQKYMKQFKAMNVDFIVQLGDLIDISNDAMQAKLLLKEIISGWASSNIPVYSVLGNHDVDSIDRKELAQILGMPSEKGYYSFTHKHMHFIVLDSDYTAHGKPYLAGTMVWDNLYIDDEQLAWLKKSIDTSSAEKTVVFIHALLDDFADAHRLINASQVRKILENSKKDISVYQGHMHKGRTSSLNGIEYNTVAATVQGENGSCYWVVTKSGKRLINKVFDESHTK